MRFKRTVIFIITVAVTAVFFASCGKSGKNEGVIKIGTISPNTGVMSVYGEAVTKAYRLAVSEINQNGGVLGKQLELVIKDDQMVSSECVNAFNSLAAEGVEFVIGSVSSSCTAAICEMANEEGIVLITPTSTADSITTEDDYVFRACFADSFQGKIAAGFAKEKGYDKVAALYCTADTYSKGIYDSFEKACGDYGIEIVLTESVSDIATCTDFSNQWTSIVNTGVGFVFAPFYYYTVAPYIVPQAREAGYDGIIMGSDSYDGANLPDYIGYGSDITYFDNVYFTNHYDPSDSSDKVRLFVEAYEAEYKETPHAFAALAYDSVYMLSAAIEKAGCASAAKVRTALSDRNTEYDCVTGKFTLDYTGTPIKDVSIVKYVSDKKTGTVKTLLDSKAKRTGGEK